MPLYQECESRFLRAGLKPAPSAATSPQAGAENQPPACGATTGWGEVLLGSVVAKEMRKKSAPRLAAATKAAGRCGAEMNPPGPGDLLRRGLILCPQRGRQPWHGEEGPAAICAAAVGAGCCKVPAGADPTPSGTIWAGFGGWGPLHSLSETTPMSAQGAP